MSEPIKLGDLVVVVKPTLCCGNDAHVGRIQLVTGFFNDGYMCPYCRYTVGKLVVALLDGKFQAKEFARLKRIPPLEELDDVKNEEEITA